MRRLTLGRLSLYVEPRDLWVGVYVAPGAVYVCPLPLIVIKWERRGTTSETLPAWQPPPPGDRREQLPDRLLALIDPPPYASTACQTADALAAAYPDHLDKHAEVYQQIQQLHARCRINNKFTGQQCICGCHTATRPTAP